MAGDSHSVEPSDPSATKLREAMLAAAPAVRRYLLATCGNWHQAEDMAQEALLRAWARRTSFDGRAEVGTWLFAIARNHWLDCLRRQAAAPTREGMEHLQLKSSAASPPAAACRTELAEAIGSAVATLPAEQREALALRESGGLTFDQIGLVLGVPAATVKSRVRYALLKLAQQLCPFERELES